MTVRALSAVIEFPLNRIRASSGPRTEGAGEVVIFPGVRIERLMFDLAERLPAQRLATSSPTRNSEFDFY